MDLNLRWISFWIACWSVRKASDEVEIWERFIYTDSRMEPFFVFDGTCFYFTFFEFPFSEKRLHPNTRCMQIYAVGSSFMISSCIFIHLAMHLNTLSVSIGKKKNTSVLLCITWPSKNIREIDLTCIHVYIVRHALISISFKLPHTNLCKNLDLN